MQINLQFSEREIATPHFSPLGKRTFERSSKVVQTERKTKFIWIFLRCSLPSPGERLPKRYLHAIILLVFFVVLDSCCDQLHRVAASRFGIPLRHIFNDNAKVQNNFHVTKYFCTLFNFFFKYFRLTTVRNNQPLYRSKVPHYCSQVPHYRS